MQSIKMRCGILGMSKSNVQHAWKSSLEQYCKGFKRETGEFVFYYRGKWESLKFCEQGSDMVVLWESEITSNMEAVWKKEVGGRETN